MLSKTSTFQKFKSSYGWNMTCPPQVHVLFEELALRYLCCFKTMWNLVDTRLADRYRVTVGDRFEGYWLACDRSPSLPNSCHHLTICIILPLPHTDTFPLTCFPCYPVLFPLNHEPQQNLHLFIASVNILSKQWERLLQTPFTISHLYYFTAFDICFLSSHQQ